MIWYDVTNVALFLGSSDIFFQYILRKLYTKFGVFVQQITYFRLSGRTSRLDYDFF